MWKHKLQKLITVGRLDIVTADGRTITLGNGHYEHNQKPLDLRIRFRTPLTPLKLAIDPYTHLGQSYMDGDLVIERGTLWDFLELVGYNFERAGPDRPNGLARMANNALRFLRQRNDLRASRQNVAHHYDLSEQLYRTFLDSDLQYSCAYFRSPDDTLEDAQLAKKDHIARKLLLRPGLRVLDIGCGWGGMALYLAQNHGVDVLGVTLSKEQLAVARARASDLGLADRVSFELIDYRNLEGTFDRIVSVGMFEHVGAPNFETYFRRVSELLTPDGLALVHSIGRMRGPARTAGFIQKHIFPGGYVPALSEVMPAIERSGLWLTDLEILRLHYADTLRHWRERFMAARHRLPPQYDLRFQRMWEFYLASSELSFRFNRFMVFQAQLSRATMTVPLTRTYMMDEDRRLVAAE